MHKPRQIAAIVSRCMKAFGQKIAGETVMVLSGCTIHYASLFFMSLPCRW